MNEEVYILNDPKQQSVSDTTSAMTVGDQTRTMTGARHPRRRHRASDHHGALATRRRRIVRQRVVPAGTDSDELVSEAVQSLDAAYTSMPLAGS